MRIVIPAGTLRLARGMALGVLTVTLYPSPAVLGQTAAAPATVELTDLTRMGTNYMAGDSFRLLVSGSPNAAVTAVATKDGVAGSETVMGRTDASGNLRIDSVWNDSEVGAYSQVWKVGGVQANPVLAFTVSAHSTVAELTDLTRSGTNYMAGDSFHLVVSGAPNTKVTVTVTKDGVAGSETEMGETDDSGNLVIGGAWRSSEAGSYSQVWKVGGVQANPTLSFSVGQRTTTVEIKDITHPDSAASYMAGDKFRVVVSGAPNETVTTTTAKDDAAGKEAVMGTTDASGNLTVEGAWNTSDAGSYSQTWKVGAAEAPALSFTIAPHTTTVAISDLTRPGKNYMAGDSFRLVVTGMPNETVTCVTTKGDTKGDEAVLGKTDASGNLTIEGIWDASEAGDYKQLWKVGGVAATELSFTLAEHVTSAELTDLTHDTGYMTGDSFQLVVSGPANQAVTSLTTKDGVEGVEAAMGKTDPSGNLTVNGVWHSSEAGSYTQVWKVGGQAAPALTFSVAQHTTAVTVTDKTRDGNYMTGDSFRVVVSGPPNQTVRLTSTKDDAAGAETVMGQTDGSGNLTIDGAWDSSDAGSYKQAWKVGGTQAPPVSFTVAQRPTTVELTDVTHNGTPYTAGDSFQVVVSGDPNQTVTLTQTKDGKKGDAAVLGKTDASGKLTLTGAWQASDAGDYTQVWSVGGVQADALTFSIVQPQ